MFTISTCNALIKQKTQMSKYKVLWTLQQPVICEGKKDLTE